MFDPIRSREITIVYLWKMLKGKDQKTKTRIKKVIKQLIAERRKNQKLLKNTNNRNRSL